MSYKKEDSVSYTFGAFPTFELVKNKPDMVTKIYMHQKLLKTADIQNLLQLCEKYNILVEINNKIVEKLRDKENIFIIGEFKKYTCELKNGNHIVLVSPSDMGNLGTIIRAALGFNFTNLAIIEPCADIFNPKTIRASMGAIFGISIKVYTSFKQYMQQFNNNNIYPFMLKATTKLQNVQNVQSPYSLVFGNEGSGLCDNFLHIGTPIIIEHSNAIDSLNLPISVCIAMYEFARN